MPELIESPSAVEITNKLSEIERHFKNTRYGTLVKDAVALYYQGRYADLDEMLKKFPTKDEMLEELIEKLKGKSIYTTLKKIGKGTATSDWTKFKGLSSLLTHVAIEAERGNTEYKYLLVDIYERIGVMLATI